ncbi:hypothetical protein ULF88_13250 [Halopseudomonas pachastrellae]|nr:hypothetical protein [Halopseudomonas pachastrellae]
MVFAQRGHVARRWLWRPERDHSAGAGAHRRAAWPVSALYGNYNRAGTVTLQSRRGGNYRDLDVSAAEFGKLDLQAAGGVEAERQRLNLAVQAVHDDGFRDQSQADRQTLAGRWALDLSPDLEVALSTRLHHAEADNPSYLPYADYQRDPYGVYSEVQNDGSEKDFRTLRLDANYQLADDVRLLSFVYHTQQDFSRWFTRPVSGIWTQREETYDRDVLGGGFNLNADSLLAGRALTWVTGIETYRERTDYLKYEDTQYRQRVGLPELDRRFSLNTWRLLARCSGNCTRCSCPAWGCAGTASRRL